MPDDELREERQRTLSDDLLDIGEAALGVTAGAALFYRSGGAKYLSAGIERTGRFLTHAHSEVSARSLRDWNSDELANVAKGLRRAWKSIGRDVEDKRIGIRSDGQCTMFNILGDIARIQKKSDEYHLVMYNHEQLINPTLDYFRQKLTNGDEAFDTKMFNFLDGLATKIDDDISVYDPMDISQFIDGEKAIAGQVVDHMRNLDSASTRNSFKVANEHIVQQVADLAANLEDLKKEYGTGNKTTIRDHLLGDKAVTIGDLLANKGKIQKARTFYKEGREHKFEDTFASFERLREEYKNMGDGFEERFLILTPDTAILRKGVYGSLRSFKIASNIMDVALDFLAGTLPGKILKMRDVQYGQKEMALQFIGKRDTAPILMTLIPGNFGTCSKLLRQMVGHSDYKRSNDVLARFFDIGQNGEETKFKQWGSIFNKYHDDTWFCNIADRLLNPTDAQRHELAFNLVGRNRNYADQMRKIRKFNTFMSKNNYELSPETSKEMLPHVGGEARDILEKLSLNDEELLKINVSREVSSVGRPDHWRNCDLVSLIHDYVADPKTALDGTTLKTDRSGVVDVPYGVGKETVTFHDILRMELGKEAFLQHAYESQEKYGSAKRHQAIIDLVDQAGLKGKEKYQAKRLGHWAAVQDITGISAKADHTRVRNVDRMWRSITALTPVDMLKWSHSCLPTPVNPISRIFGLLDPYWLKRKHADDRPYPILGTLFSNDILWGAVLNPTIDEMIKSQKGLHSDRMEDGADDKALIYRMNNKVQIKALNRENQNLVVLKGGTMEPMEVTVYNAPTEAERVYSMQFLSDKMTNAATTDFGHYNGSVMPNAYMNRSGNGGVPMSIKGSAESTAEGLTVSEKLELDGSTGNTISAMANNYIKHMNPIVDIGHNDRQISVKAQMNSNQGIMMPEKIVNLRASYGASLLNDIETANELMNMYTGNDMIKEFALSAKLIMGIYGYGLNKTTGFGDNTGKRIAASADMNSSFRTFWDSGFGGVGGESMEIARRFMPEFKRNSRFNPLMNTIPDWLPDTYQFGDGFTALPKGEVRLPDKEFESLNEINPNQFGEYGAFDRMKILADIAPYSPEYKVWKKVAPKTAIDPKVKEEMMEIKERTTQQGKTHEFYDYKIVGRGADYKNVTVTEILERDKFKVYGSDEFFKLAGVKLNSSKDDASTQEILSQYLHPGQAVTIATDENESYRHNSDTDNTVSAAIFANGENVSKALIGQGLASRRKGDRSLAATIGQYSPSQQERGWVAETIAHMDLPLIHNQWLRVRSLLESYNAKQVYGTPYQTWSDPMGTFLLPMMERAVSDHGLVMAGEVASHLQRISANIAGKCTTTTKVINAAYMLTNHGAFIGGALGYIIKPDTGTVMRGGARISAALMTVGQLYAGTNDPFESALGFGHIGFEVTEFLKTFHVKGAVTGAAVGVALYGVNNSILVEKKEWITDHTKKKWEMQEYFDRLSYIKYIGLYHEASSKALNEEDTNIELLVNQQERDAAKKKDLCEVLESAEAKVGRLPQGTTHKNLEEVINKKLQDAQESQLVLHDGRYTQSAFLYKQAADSIAYGLKENAIYPQPIRALSKNDREYFMEFVQERDTEKRENILKISSPIIARMLKRVWGEKVEDMERNSSYFMNHNLPSFSWSGWTPDVDLTDVQVKTILNEGMLLSNFGFYESQLRDPDVINAPNLDPHGNQDPLTLQANLQATLKGLGLWGVNVSVQPAPMSGIEVVANVARIVENKIESAVHDIFGLL